MRSNVSPVQVSAVTHEQPAHTAISPEQRINASAKPSVLTFLTLTIILPVFAIAPLFYPGYFQTHDGFVFLWNIIDLRANFGNLNWLPPIATQFDPLRGNGLLIYYLTAFLPFAPAVALKTVIGAGWLLGSVGIFLWLKSWLGCPGALIAALTYTYLPHQIATVYIRGAWGEAFFWNMLPWVILTTTYLVTSPRPGLLPVAAFFWVIAGLSQLGLTLWALIFVILLLITIHFSQALLPVLAALSGTGLVIALYFAKSPATLFLDTSVPFFDHFLYPFQLVSAYWGHGVSRPGWDDGLSFQLGMAALGLAFLSIYLWQRPASVEDTIVSRTDRRLIFFAVSLLVITLLQFELAAFIWRLPLWPGQLLAATLTYPWQIIGLAGLSLSVMAGAAIWLSPEGQLAHLPTFSAIIVLVILSVYSYLLPQFIQPDTYAMDVPQAELGQSQLVILDHHFSVAISGHSAGFERPQTSIPLAVYGSLQAGDILMLHLNWQPLRSFDRDLKVFVHLVDPNNNVLAQFDGQPKEGDHPMSAWIPGEIIEDTYPIYFPADAPAGPYRVFLGLYDEATLQRLPVSRDEAGRVIFDVQ